MTLSCLKPGVQLYPNQVGNVKEFLKRRKALLTDKAGSGKTFSVIYAYAYLKEKNKIKNMIVLTPLNAYSKRVWANETKKYTYLKTIDIADLAKICVGNNEKLKKMLGEYDIIYGKHTHSKQLRQLVKAIVSLPHTLLVTDEIHAFRNSKSGLTIAFRSCIVDCQTHWGLSATPLSKNLEDTYNIINLIKPFFLGYFNDFRERYCETRDKVIGRTANGLRTVTEIIGIKDPVAFTDKISELVIVGESFLEVQFNFVDYENSHEEKLLYKQIANGINSHGALTSEDWIKSILKEQGKLDELEPNQIKEVQRHSSRFIYLQTAADGVLTKTGSQDSTDSVKIRKLLQIMKEQIDKGESGIIYFDYLAPLNCAKRAIRDAGLKCKVFESSGDNVLKENDVTEAKCKIIPHWVLSTRAGSESVSYYFMNNVVYFHIPTVPHTFAQFTGRITRKNTLFPDDLKCWIFRSNNIDLYKMMVVSAKSFQMELVSGEDRNIPPDYKQIVSKMDILDKMKKILLWNTK